MKKNVFIAITLMLFSYSGIASYASPITGQSTLSVSEDDNSGNLDSLSVEQLRDSLNSLIRYANAILITGKREKEYYGELPLYEECEKTLTTSMEKAWELVNTDSKDKEAIIAAINDLADKSSDAKQIVHEYDTYFLNSEYEVTHLYNELDEDGKAAFRKMMGVRILKDPTPCHHPDITTWKRYYLKTFVDSVYMMAIRQQSTYGVDMTKGIKYNECNSGYEYGQFGDNELHLAKVKDWTVLRIADDTTVVDMPENFHVNTSIIKIPKVEDKRLGPDQTYTEWVNTAENPDYLKNNHVIIRHDTETGFRPGRYVMMFRIDMFDFKSSPKTVEGFNLIANGVANTADYDPHDHDVACVWTEFYVGEDGIMDYAFEFDHTNFNTFMFYNMYLTYYGIANAVENVIAQKDAPSEIYSLNGIRQTTVKKGISIIRNADGSVTKLIK